MLGEACKTPGGCLIRPANLLLPENSTQPAVERRALFNSTTRFSDLISIESRVEQVIVLISSADHLDNFRNAKMMLLGFMPVPGVSNTSV